MKSFLITFLCFITTSVWAADVGQITMVAPKAAALVPEKSNITEAGMNYSSLNDGSLFATIALVHEWDNGFAAGVRGFLPMQYTKQEQAYMGQVLGRFIILNDIDQMYIEGTLAQGFFNGSNDGMPFFTLGTDYGYMHKFTDKLAAGGSLGLDYSDRRITGDTLYNQRTLYSKLSIFGAFYF
jgi:hypothetical protein